jgi:hypothetical protein
VLTLAALEVIIGDADMTLSSLVSPAVCDVNANL